MNYGGKVNKSNREKMLKIPYLYKEFSRSSGASAPHCFHGKSGPSLGISASFLTMISVCALCFLKVLVYKFNNLVGGTGVATQDRRDIMISLCWGKRHERKHNGRHCSYQ